MTNSGFDRTISASDVEKFGYCPLSWWLSEQKNDVDIEKLEEGTHKHEKLGKEVKKIKTHEKVGEESERSWILFSIIAVIMGINGLAIVYTIYAPESQGQVITVLLSIISVLWVIVAVYFFYKRIVLEREMKYLSGELPKVDSEVPSDMDIKKRISEAKLNTFLFFLVSGILALHGFLILLNLEPDESQLRSIIFLILALIWLFGSTIFYYISLKKEMRSKEAQEGVQRKSGKWTFSESEMSVILFAVIATILASNALTMLQNPPSDFARILFVIAILWLYGGFIFLYRALLANVKLRLLIQRLLLPKRASLTKTQDEIDEIDYEEATMTYEKGVLWFAIVAMILALNAIILNFLNNIEDQYGTYITNFFIVIVPLWLIGAAIFLYVVIVSSRTAEKLRIEHGIKSGKIEYVDALDDKSEMLSSEKYGLRGRPDYILKRDEGLVPVEVKTGRTPKGPLFSHILQLAAYCLLIEENYKTQPPYGIIKYSEIEHEIEYDDGLKEILLTKLEEMRKIFKTVDAHRNHKRESKCRFCSRRAICPEKLV
jgi:CRISPR-associated exonuclease Cas4